MEKNKCSGLKGSKLNACKNKNYSRKARLKELAEKGFYPVRAGSDIAKNSKGDFRFIDTRGAIYSE